MTIPDTRTDDRSRAAWKAFDSVTHVARDGQEPLHRAAIAGLRAVLQVASPSIVGASFSHRPLGEGPGAADYAAGPLSFSRAFGAGGAEIELEDIDGFDYPEFIARVDEYLAAFRGFEESSRHFDSVAIDPDSGFVFVNLSTRVVSMGPDDQFARSAQTVRHLAVSLTDTDAEALIEALLARPAFTGLAFSRTAVVNDLNDIRAVGGLELIEDISDASWRAFRDGSFVAGRFDMDVATPQYLSALRMLPEGKTL